MDPDRLFLRPIAESDRSFLLNLYSSTREKELTQTGWNNEQKLHFITMQFMAQQKHYHEHYPDASFDIIQYKDIAIGRLYLEEWTNQFRVIDIALLPQHCNQGVGSFFLKCVMQQARALGKTVSIHVEQSNPALRLYQRLGFIKTSEQGTYFLMKWQKALLHNKGKK